MKRTIFHLCFILLAVFVVSCSSVRSPLALRVRSRKLPEADVVRSFPAESATVSTPDRWWEAFGSEELNDLMERAFRRNLSVASAWTRLRQAQSAAVLASADGKLLLTGTAKAETTKRRTEGRDTGDTDSYNSFQAGLGLSYELDLWGRIHAGTRAAGREIMASEQDVMATALALSGQLTAAWLQHGAAQAELATVRDQIGTSKKSLDLLKVRQRKGMSELVDVLQQQQQVSGLESVVPGLRETIAIQKLQIAYLLGEPADADLGLREGGLPALPGLPATGVPAEILARRPDVQVAWHQLMAQEWAVVAARADRLPTLSLSATVALSSPDIGRIFDNWLATLAANLVAPILDGGRRKAVVNRDRALADARFIAYRDTVLVAMREVTEALVRERWRGEALSRLQSEADYATQMLEETQRRYRNGLSDYLPVLSAFSIKQNADRALVRARHSLLANRVSLHQALGGTWMNSLVESNE